MLNEREWVILNGYGDGQDVTLDAVIEESYLPQNLVAVSVLYPSHWPAGVLGERAPEYAGRGEMLELLVVYPKMSTYPSDVLALTMVISNYSFEEFDRYVESLGSYGFWPVLKEELDFPEYALEYDDTYNFYANEEGFCALQNITEALGTISFVFYQTQPAERPPKDTRLLNYLELSETLGIEPSVAQLDQYGTYDGEYGRTTASYFLPSAWPGRALGDIILEYTYFGFMYETVLTYLQQKAEEDILIASIYLGEWEAGDLPRYVDELVARGFYLLDEDKYDEQDLALQQQRETRYILVWPGIKCYVGPTEYDGAECLQISVRFDGRYSTFFSQQ